jgi:hypothetical protein
MTTENVSTLRWKTTQVSFTPFYENRIPHWRMNIVQTTKNRAPEILLHTLDISCCFGSFVRVGNFMWNHDQNTTVLAFDKLAKICKERPDDTDLRDGVTNQWIWSLREFGGILADLYLHTNNKLVSTTSDSKVSFRKNADVHSHDNRMRTHARPINTLQVSLGRHDPHIDMMDDRSPIDAKPNAPFVTNLKMQVDCSNCTCSKPYKSLLKHAFDDRLMKLPHISSTIFASFGVAGMLNATYEAQSTEVDERMKTIVEQLSKLEDVLFFQWSSFHRFESRTMHRECNVHPPLF